MIHMSEPSLSSGIPAIGPPPGCVRQVEFARRLGINKNTLAQWVRAGMPTIRVGREAWIQVDAASAWIQRERRNSVAFGRESVVYFVRRADGCIKIGFTSDLDRRLLELRKKFRCQVECLATAAGGADVEARVHRRFADAHVGEEWFSPAPALVELVARVAAGEDLIGLLGGACDFDALSDAQLLAMLDVFCGVGVERSEPRTIRSLRKVGMLRSFGRHVAMPRPVQSAFAQHLLRRAPIEQYEATAPLVAVLLRAVSGVTPTPTDTLEAGDG